jgi:hypothetical protein
MQAGMNSIDGPLQHLSFSPFLTGRTSFIFSKGHDQRKNRKEETGEKR